MIIRTPLIAAGAVVLAAGLVGCSSDDSDDTATATTTAAASADATATSAATSANAPSAEALNATLTTFFDPTVPAAEKVVLIDDGQNQAAVIEQFNGVLQGYPLTAEVTAVTPVDDDTVKTTTTIAGPHGGAPTEVVFDEENGAWVISSESVCSILGMGRLTCAQ
ncbi:nuclear transport factor 2 family protein [Rhodococcus gannanensis]|uniref:Nuclear transport factor 2 family protein n=1 Tax=Rhodococcus gannanensis TaxID=1960308 RepID=A0ABW4P5E3_9NOCA